ncbi:MAG: glycoside hydrolase family 15 protein [Chloroflexales bacterium]
MHPFIRDHYTADDIAGIQQFLNSQGTFHFFALPTGLFPAAHLSARGEYSGYDKVWVRDNMHVAHGLYITGQPEMAVRAVRSTLDYFHLYRHRFDAIIRGEADPEVPMNRPHIRFDGKALREVNDDWSHAQNDALGYVLWLACRMAADDELALSSGDLELLGRFPLYFRAIRYWQDKDSGHWEEKRKVEASSIGVVVAGLRALRTLLATRGIETLAIDGEPVSGALLDTLIGAGEQALDTILPAECIDPTDYRAYDAALLFLIYPLDVVSPDQQNAILAHVETHLRGEYGIRRYLSDSFWCANYDELMNENERTSNVSEDMSARDALVKPGEEAQWCVFDPVMSTIYGRRYLVSGDPADAQQQRVYFNRALSQLTGSDSGFHEFLCPELYYLKRDRYVPNDVTPLLWTQANLLIAFEAMQRSLAQ